jgi:hypothetical protein
MGQALMRWVAGKKAGSSAGGTNTLVKEGGQERLRALNSGERKAGGF